MNLTKEIIDEIVSYIDLKDIRDFILTHEKNTIFIIGSIVTNVAIQKISNLEYMIYDMKGGRKG